MSTLLGVVKTQRLNARKERDTVTVSVLTTLMGELETLSKKTGKEITNEMVVSTCKKFIANNDETIQNSGDHSTETLETENKILAHFLPKQLTEAELVAIITDLNPSNIGEAMGHLKANYAGQYDGKLASQVARNHI